MKKLVTLLLVLAMLLSMACVPAYAADELDKDAEIVIWLPGNGSVPGYEENATEDDNRFINAIREKTGYKNLKAYVMPATDGVQQMNLLIAAGDYPDAIYVNSNFDFWREYLNQGFWAPVDENFEKYGSNMKDLITEDVWATMAASDGLHYGLPIPRHTSYEGKFLGDGIMYRSDLMAELGMEAPTTLEGFYDLLVAVKAKYPDMIPYANTNINSNRIQAVFGMWNEFGVDADGKVYSKYDANMKDYLTFMNKLYTEGLLDPESSYQTGAQRREKIVAGKVFAWDDGVWSKEMRQAWAETGTPYKAEFLPEFPNNDGTSGMADAFAAANFWAFPVTSDKQAEVIDLINTFLGDKELEDFINYGVYGEHYVIDENGVYQTVEGYEAVIYKIYYRLWFRPEVWWNNAVLGDFVPEIESWYNATKGFDNIDLFAYMPASDAKIEFGSSVADIRDEYTAKIITGELPIDAADEMLSNMYASGYTQIIEAAQAWYDETGKVLAEQLGF